MTTYFGCTPGDTLSWCSAATRRAVFQPSATVARVGDRRVSLATDEHMIVLWHQSDAGTWHGFYDPDTFRNNPKPGYRAYSKHGKCPTITPARAAITQSSSGNGIAIGVVAVVPPEGIIWVTSRYMGRGGWEVHYLPHNGDVQSMSLADFRASNGPVEKL
jgi:hypothetical protein